MQQVLAARYDVVAPQETAGKAMHIIGQRAGAAVAAPPTPAVGEQPPAPPQPPVG